MKIVKSIRQMRKELTDKKGIGLVPTMGYLHAGHLSLVKRALKENNIVVASIFVNPAQFAPGEDYDEYPRDLERDAGILKEMGVDYVFSPRVAEMYPEGYNTYVEVEELSDYLCGASREGFFRGVATVVSKLLNIVNPDQAYFGEKDFQQYLIIKRMVRDLNFPVKIKKVPIVREEDGLALSSRNEYLNTEEREAATILYQSLQKGKEMIKNGERDARKIRNQMMTMINEKKLAEIDYVEVVDPESLERITELKDQVLLAMAVFIGDTRLIDNFYLEIE